MSWEFPPLVTPSVFLGSPSDVKDLREGVRRQLDELIDKMADDHGVRPFLWEWSGDHIRDDYLPQYPHDRPYQASVPLPAGPNCVAAIFLFGERIGSALPPDFNTAPIDGTPANVSAHPLIRYWRKDVPENGFPLTGSTFEYLVAEMASTPRLVVFLGDEYSLQSDEHVLDQNWGLNLLKNQCESKNYEESDRWRTEEGIPQRTALRNFFRYIKQDRATPVEIAPSKEKALEIIRDFLVSKLQIGEPGRINPFRGLTPYDVGDNRTFFGRDSLRKLIVGSIRSLAENGLPERRPFFRIFGGSGSGKSSLMRAGVIGHLSSPLTLGNWVAHVTRPSDLASSDTTKNETDVLLPLYLDCLAGITRDDHRTEDERATDRARALKDLRIVSPEHRAATAVERLVEALDARRGLEGKGPWRLVLGISLRSAWKR